MNENKKAKNSTQKKRKTLSMIFSKGVAAAAIIAACGIGALDSMYVKASMIEGKENTIEETQESTEDVKENTEKVQSINIAILKNSNVGDTVTFGRFEQDCISENGPEDISWKVIAKREDCILLLSEYGLDTKMFNENVTDGSWADSSIRHWLNEEFYEYSFSQEELERIALYRTDVVSEITDKVFLLSEEEVVSLLPDKEDRVCFATKYAEHRPGMTLHQNAEKGNVMWWLRTSGPDQKSGKKTDKIVFEKNEICTTGYPVDNTEVCVRPAIVIRTEEE